MYLYQYIIKIILAIEDSKIGGCHDAESDFSTVATTSVVN